MPLPLTDGGAGVLARRRVQPLRLPGERTGGGSRRCRAVDGSQQQLTREVRQFETVFVSAVDLRVGPRGSGSSPRTRSSASRAIRCSAPPRCCTPSLAAAAAEETWTLKLSERNVTVRTRGRDGWIDASMDQGSQTSERIVTGELADRYRRALGLPPAAVHPDLPMQVVSTGLPYLIVPVPPGILRLRTSRLRLRGDAGRVRRQVRLRARSRHSGRADLGQRRSGRGRCHRERGRPSRRVPHPAWRPSSRCAAAARPGPFTGRPSTIEVRREPSDGHYWVGGPVAPVASGRFHARLAD